MQLEETAADEMAIDIHTEELDDRTRGMQYIIILYDVGINFFTKPTIAAAAHLREISGRPCPETAVQMLQARQM